MSKHAHHRAIKAHAQNIPPAVSASDMINKFVKPALLQMGMYDLSTEQLLMGTAAIKSRFTYVRQFPTGPGRGYWQMERETHDDLWESFLSRSANKELADQLKLMLNGEGPNVDICQENHVYAAAMARVKYMTRPGVIPLTLKTQAHYWKVHYNGNSAHGRPEADYLKVWNELCSGVYPDFK